MKLNENGGDVKINGNGTSPVGKLKLSVPTANGGENGIVPELGKEMMAKDKGKDKDIVTANSETGGMMSPDSLEAS